MATKKNLPAGYKSMAEYEESAEWDGRLLRAKFMKVYGLTEPAMDVLMDGKMVYCDESSKDFDVKDRYGWDSFAYYVYCSRREEIDTLIKNGDGTKMRQLFRKLREEMRKKWMALRQEAKDTEKHLDDLEKHGKAHSEEWQEGYHRLRWLWDVVGGSLPHKELYSEDKGFAQYKEKE